MIERLTSLDTARARSATWRLQGETVGFVPTMGALHAGHLSLVAAALERCDRVVASIFVNPTQFGAGEDLDTYPRDLAGDASKLEAAGAHALFTTSPGEMYPDGFATWVVVEGLTDVLCGATRPSHFRGVTTVVTKLLHIVDPDDAFFGEKDRQQLVVIKRMAEDLNLRPRIHGCPIVRAPDGLALSSRNLRLSAEERRRSLSLSRGLRLATQAFAEGERDTRSLEAIARRALDVSALREDYVAAVSPRNLQRVTHADDQTILLVAAFAGAIRLIDNHVLGRPFPAVA